MDREALEKLILLRNRTNPFTRLLGITITKIETGFAQAEMTIRPDLLNPNQNAHGGCLYTLADTCMGAAAVSYGTRAVTLSSDYHFLAPASEGQKVIAAARCLRPGNTVLPIDVELRLEDDTLLCKGTFTAYRLKNQPIIL